MTRAMQVRKQEMTHAMPIRRREMMLVLRQTWFVAYRRNSRFYRHNWNSTWRQVRVVGKLTDPALNVDDLQWKTNVARFWELRWAELEMVGDQGIREAMRRIQQQIIETEYAPTRNRHDLRWSVECLADEVRLALEHSWGIKRDPNRITATGLPASKLPNGCYSTEIGLETLPGMLPLEAPGNLVHLNAPGAR
jgi:hypothetical protein